MMTAHRPVRSGVLGRAGAIVALCAGLVVGCAGQGDSGAVQPWWGGYVKVTSTPWYEFEARDASEQGRPVLSFVVADPEDSCAPSWGGYDGLEGAGTTFGLDAAVETLYEQGGAAVVAFGG